MTLQQLEYIVALDSFRHFVKASEHCMVTQPTLTMQVKKLEEEIGSAIFNRQVKPLEPTKVGISIVAKAREIIREVNQLKELVSEHHENLTGVFRIGIIPTITPYLLPLFIGNFIKNNPKAELIIEELKSTDIIDGLKQDKLDIGILVTPLDEYQLREIRLYNEPFLGYFSEGHKLFGKQNIKQEELNSSDGLWLLNEGHCFRDQVLNICSHTASKEHSTLTYQSGSVETLKRLIQRNYGYTLIPQMSADANDPHVSKFTDPQPIREVSLVVHKSFSKEILIERLRDEVLAVIPEDFKVFQNYYKVRWRY